MVGIERTVIDGRIVSGAEVALVLQARYGHFTAMQVRGGRVRGLGHHLDRLGSATRELFGQELDRDLVVDSIKALAVVDASVRVYVCESGGPRVLVGAGAPVHLAATPKGLRSVRYQRFLPHIKHTGGFPQAYLGAQVRAEGFDEALLTGDDGVISEGAITNVGCFDGERVIWPDAPMLRGVTMQVMEAELDRAGVPCEHRVLRAGDLAAFGAVFLTNSWGVVAVDRVDDIALKVDQGLMARLTGLYDATPWDTI